jgi:hypothetical protein
MNGSLWQRAGSNGSLLQGAKGAHQAFDVLTICERAIQPTDQVSLPGNAAALALAVVPFRPSHLPNPIRSKRCVNQTSSGCALGARRRDRILSVLLDNSGGTVSFCLPLEPQRPSSAARRLGCRCFTLTGTFGSATILHRRHYFSARSLSGGLHGAAP